MKCKGEYGAWDKNVIHAAWTKVDPLSAEFVHSTAEKSSPINPFESYRGIACVLQKEFHVSDLTGVCVCADIS